MKTDHILSSQCKAVEFHGFDYLALPSFSPGKKKSRNMKCDLHFHQCKKKCVEVNIVSSTNILNSVFGIHKQALLVFGVSINKRCEALTKNACPK